MTGVGVNVTGGYTGDHGISGLFLHLIGLPDEAVLGILAIVMGETLEAGSSLIEVLGVHLDVEMASVWQADNALLHLIRDLEVLNHMVADVAGEKVAEANAGETAKVQRQIVRDCLAGSNGRVEIVKIGAMTLVPVDSLRSLIDRSRQGEAK